MTSCRTNSCGQLHSSSPGAAWSSLRLATGSVIPQRLSVSAASSPSVPVSGGGMHEMNCMSLGDIPVEPTETILRLAGPTPAGQPCGLARSPASRVLQAPVAEWILHIVILGRVCSARAQPPLLLDAPPFTTPHHTHTHASVSAGALLR